MWERGTHNLKRTEVGTVRRPNKSKSVISTHFLEQNLQLVRAWQENKQVRVTHLLEKAELEA